MVAALLSMQGLKALRCHKKYLTVCSENEQISYGFGMTILGEKLITEFSFLVEISLLIYRLHIISLKG